MSLFPSIAHKPRALQDIDWEETSGVDHPANQEEGWMVMKSLMQTEGADDLLKMIESEERMTKAYEGLGQALIVVSEGEFMDDAPDDVRKSAENVAAWLVKSGYVQTTKKQPANAAEPFARSRTLVALKDFLGRLVGKAEKTEGEPAQEVDVIKEAFAQTWPAFCETIANIKKSQAAADVKKSLIAKAVADLSSSVQEAIEKHGKFKHDNTEHTAKAGETGECSKCGTAVKTDSVFCAKCGTRMNKEEETK